MNISWAMWEIADGVCLVAGGAGETLRQVAEQIQRAVESDDHEGPLNILITKD